MLFLILITLSAAASGLAGPVSADDLMEILVVRDNVFLIAGADKPGDSVLFEIVRPQQGDTATIGLARVTRRKKNGAEMAVVTLSKPGTIRAGEDLLRRARHEYRINQPGAIPSRVISRACLAGPSLNFPAAPVGIFYGAYNHSGFGGYLDFKWRPDSPERHKEPFYPGLQLVEVESELGHEVTEEWISDMVVNLGLTRKLRGRLAGYLGLGLHRRVSYARLHDPAKRMGRNGDYLIRGPDSGLSVNLSGGFIWLSRGIYLCFGVDSVLPGISISFGLQY